MRIVKENFIKMVINGMEEADFTQKEIAEILVILEQRLEEQKDFLEDLEKWQDNLSIWISRYEEDYYELLRIRIDFSKDYSYQIIIRDKEEMIGYCMCTNEDEGYVNEYSCCGKCCDWYRPTFILEKTNKPISFIGLQADYWKAQEEFIDKYFEVDEESRRKEEERKRKERELIDNIGFYRDIIRDLEKRLEELR